MENSPRGDRWSTAWCWLLANVRLGKAHARLGARERSQAHVRRHADIRGQGFVRHPRTALVRRVAGRATLSDRPTPSCSRPLPQEMSLTRAGAQTTSATPPRLGALTPWGARRGIR